MDRAYGFGLASHPNPERIQPEVSTWMGAHVIEVEMYVRDLVALEDSRIPAELLALMEALGQAGWVAQTPLPTSIEEIRSLITAPTLPSGTSAAPRTLRDHAPRPVQSHSIARPRRTHTHKAESGKGCLRRRSPCGGSRKTTANRTWTEGASTPRSACGLASSPTLPSSGPTSSSNRAFRRWLAIA